MIVKSSGSSKIIQLKNNICHTPLRFLYFCPGKKKNFAIFTYKTKTLFFPRGQLNSMLKDLNY